MKNLKTKNSLAIISISFLFFLNCPKGNATVIEVSDNIDFDVTWTADTVKILNDISILPAATLTVNPGRLKVVYCLSELRKTILFLP
jgi:hypothetical protein